MSNKGEGRYIGIKFTEDLIGDVSEGNNVAFNVIWQEYLYINGPIVTKKYSPISVTRKPGTVDTLLLEMDQYQRFNNALNNVTVEYNILNGNLRGLGGFVEGFIQEFLPEDLVSKVNPGVAEHFNVMPEVILGFKKVDLIHGYSFEHFEITPSVTLNFEFVGEINP